MVSDNDCYSTSTKNRIRFTLPSEVTGTSILSRGTSYALIINASQFASPAQLFLTRKWPTFPRVIRTFSLSKVWDLARVLNVCVRFMPDGVFSNRSLALFPSQGRVTDSFDIQWRMFRCTGNPSKRIHQVSLKTHYWKTNKWWTVMRIKASLSHASHKRRSAKGKSLINRQTVTDTRG